MQQEKMIVLCQMDSMKTKARQRLYIPSPQFCYCKESNSKTIIIMFGKLRGRYIIIEEQFTIYMMHIRQVVTKDYQIDWPLRWVGIK